MNQEILVRRVGLSGLIVTLTICLALFGSHLAKRRTQANKEQAELQKERLVLTDRAAGLLYSAKKRAGDCEISEARDLLLKAKSLLADPICTFETRQEFDRASEVVVRALDKCEAVILAQQKELEDVRHRRTAERARRWIAILAGFEEGKRSLDTNRINAAADLCEDSFPDKAHVAAAWRKEAQTISAQSASLKENIGYWKKQFLRWTRLAGRLCLVCSRCNGSKLVGCPDCRGKLQVFADKPCRDSLCSGGQQKCYGCMGTGRCSCLKCGGSGSFTKETVVGGGLIKNRHYYAVACSQCGGQGRLQCNRCGGDVSRRFPCDRCNGSGKIRGYINCPTCMKGKITCSSCIGTGELESLVRLCPQL